MVKRTMWIQLGVTLAILSVLLTGCDGQGGAQNNEAVTNQIAQLSNQIQTLQGQLEDSINEIAQLKAQASSSGNTSNNGAPANTSRFRIGFVNAEEVFVKYKGTEDAIQKYRLEKQDKEDELRNLQDQFSAGAISQNEYLTKRTELETLLQSLDQQLTNEITQRIVEVVEEIGESLGYDLVTSRKNVVLYYREDGFVDDLTESVLQKMNEDFEAASGS